MNLNLNCLLDWTQFSQTMATSHALSAIVGGGIGMVTAMGVEAIFPSSASPTKSTTQSVIETVGQFGALGVAYGIAGRVLIDVIGASDEVTGAMFTMGVILGSNGLREKADVLITSLKLSGNALVEADRKNVAQ